MQVTRTGSSSFRRAGVGDLRPLRFEDYKRETLRDLLGYDYDDFDAPRPSLATTAAPRRSWWAVYGVLVVMILVMMATLAWAWVDRDTEPSPPAAGTPASVAPPAGG